MAEDNKNIINENENNSSGKKKKMIIAAVIVVIIAVAAAAVMIFANKDDNKSEASSDSVSSSETTTLAPGLENGVIDDRGEQNTDYASSPSGNSSSSNHDSSSGGNTSENQGGSGSSGSDLTTEPATAPKSRQLEISVIMPNDGNTDDVLEIIINGESIGTVDKINNEPLKTNGKTFTFVTADKYEGDVAVEARLQNYQSSAGVKILEGYNKASIALPLDGVEENFAPDL